MIVTDGSLSLHVVSVCGKLALSHCRLDVSMHLHR